MNALYHQSLEEGLEILCVRYCWFCSTEQAYHLWKHWRPTGSVQIINMHGNQYIFGSGGEKNWEKHRKRAEALECSSSFITVIYSLSLSSLCYTCAHTHFFTYARAYTCVCVCTHRLYACTARERERKNVQISKLSILFSPTVPVGLCSV